MAKRKRNAFDRFMDVAKEHGAPEGEYTPLPSGAVELMLIALDESGAKVCGFDVVLDGILEKKKGGK